MKEVDFMGWKNCVEISSGDFKLVVTTEVGPRIIGGFIGKSENIFYVDPERAGKKGGDEWFIYGGHRIWHSPEDKPRTYCPDNDTVQIKKKGGEVEFSSGIEKTTGISKCFSVRPLGKRRFEIVHRLRNHNMWSVELAAWALTVMAQGGTAIIPIPQGDRKSLLPNRYITVWPYSDLDDPRVSLGKKKILIRQDTNAKGAFKLGLNCEDGWIAYANKGFALVKRFKHLVDAAYPDNGCSIECYSCNFMLEIETLSPLYQLDPGEEIVHVETWEGMSEIPEISDEKIANKIFG